MYLPRRLESFVRHRRHFAFEFNTTRFWERAMLPGSHKNSLHPALVTAMMLNACRFSHPSFRSHEARFIWRFRKDLSQSLAYVDRLLDFVKASTLIGAYFYTTARYTCLSIVSLAYLLPHTCCRRVEGHNCISSMLTNLCRES